ncbi:GNAT family N-acetyltransferase [bacterium]|nr:GNAT family N-acetyltransferase [bacterium]
MGARLEIPIDRAWTPTAQAFVEQVARRYGIPASGSSELARACAPLLDVLLGQEFLDHNPSLQLFGRVIPGGLEIVVADQGLPFDQEMWTRPQVASRLQALQGTIDQLEFVNLGLSGKETRLRKYFAVAPQESEPEPAASDRPQSPLHEIRAFQPQDAEAICRCIWRTYGYSYSVQDAVYLPERLRALNQDGLMCSLVATNQAGEVIGHMAYERSQVADTLVTAGVAAVEPAYRSQGIASQMAPLLLERARQDGAEAMHCYAVTSHPYSQRLVHSIGFDSCCVVLGASLFCFEGIPIEGNQRESMVGYFQALKPQALELKGPLYAPNRHRAMLESLCQHLKLKAHFDVPPQRLELMPGESRLQLQESPPRKTAKIHVENYGSSILERIRSHARYLRLQDYRCFQLTLPLYDPYTYHILKPLEKMGFFFSGIQFRSIGPCLLLQDLYGVTLDYQQLKIEDEMARELLSYVRYMEPEAV